MDPVALATYRTRWCAYKEQCREQPTCAFAGHLPRRRRNPDLIKYEPILCTKRDCEDAWACRYAHSLDEVLYHPRFYGRIACVPELCPGRKVCWMRHADDDAPPKNVYATPPAPAFPPGLPRPSPGAPAATRGVRDMLPYLEFLDHESDTRRHPLRYEYAPRMCRHTEFNDRGVATRRCDRGNECKFAHSRAEVEYHPLNYKTQLCTHGTACTRAHCPYFHADENCGYALTYTARYKAHWEMRADERAKNGPPRSIW